MGLEPGHHAAMVLRIVEYPFQGAGECRVAEFLQGLEGQPGEVDEAVRLRGRAGHAVVHLCRCRSLVSHVGPRESVSVDGFCATPAGVPGPWLRAALMTIRVSPVEVAGISAGSPAVFGLVR